MNIRKALYFGYSRLRGRLLVSTYDTMVREDKAGQFAAKACDALAEMLTHCKHKVPYYSEALSEWQGNSGGNPDDYLRRLPILTKELLRQHFEELKSLDLSRRDWYVERSGGSTGEPVRFIHDREYHARTTAATLFFARWAGHEFGEPQISLWGSERDLFEGSMGLKAQAYNFIYNVRYLNAFRMSPEKMRGFLDTINRAHPRLIVAYAQALFELAKFAQQNNISVLPQSSIMTSAGTLYPFMRDTIGKVFQGKVFNRYGSREVGAIASQCPQLEGLHVSPWTQYVEVVDEDGNPMPPGVEGDILVTSLANFAMPLIRYKIGDRGVLAQGDAASMGCSCGRSGQVIEKVLGRSTDNFRTSRGKVVPGEYFIHLIGVVLNKGSIKQFQIVQISYNRIVLRIVKENKDDYVDTEELASKIEYVMSEPCTVHIEFVESIPPESSGKYRYTISEVTD